MNQLNQDPIQVPATDAGRDPFALPVIPSNPLPEPLPPRRPRNPKQTRTIIFFVLMAVVISTVVYVMYFHKHGNSGVANGFQATTGSINPSVNLREDQTRQFEQLMTALGQERKLAENENKKILNGLNGIQTNITADDKRIQKLEELSSELVSRGLVHENSHTDAASLPEAIQPLCTPAITFCQKSLEERGLYGWSAMRQPFTEWVKTQSPNIDQEDIHRLYEIAQVSREPIADAHYDVIPQLSRKRIALRIPRDDVAGTVHLIWLERATLPPTTPGQLVSLANLVNRAEASTGGAKIPEGDVGSGGLAEYQDLVVPRDIHIGFEPCKSTDVVQIVALAIPYLTGGLTIPDQDPVLAAYYATRAKPAAISFLKRQSDRPSALLAALLEESQRQARLPRTTVIIDGSVDPKLRTFVAACIEGLVLARAVREGVLESNRLTMWGTEMAGTIPSETIAAIDLSLVQRAYGTITARDLSTPIGQPVVSEAMDRAFISTVMTATKSLAPIDRGRFLVSAAIQASAAAVVAGRTGDQISAESIGATIQRTVRITVAQIEAQALVHHAIDDELIPAYAGLYEGNTRDWSSASSSFLDAAIASIDATLSSRLGEDPSNGLTERLYLTGRSEAETAIARMAALDSINRDLDRFATESPLTLMRLAREHSLARVNQAISVLTPRDTQIRTAYAIAREAIAIAQGKRRVRKTSVSLESPTNLSRIVNPNPIGDADHQIAADEAIQIFHAVATTKPKVKYVTIPAGAYAEGRIYSGVVCELGNEKPEPMLINLDYSWSGPAGTELHMKDLRLIAECTAMGGAPRVRAHVITVSYDLPDGTHMSLPVDGWVVDNVVGEAGAIGTWNWNLGAIAPLGVLDGVLGGLAGLLKPNQQTTSVNTNITIQQTDTTPAKNLGEGAATGLDNSIGKHIEKTLENIRPSVEVPNNKPCTVVMKTDVILPIPVELWNAVVEEVETAKSSGFQK